MYATLTANLALVDVVTVGFMLYLGPVMSIASFTIGLAILIQGVSCKFLEPSPFIVIPVGICALAGQSFENPRDFWIVSILNSLTLAFNIFYPTTKSYLSWMIPGLVYLSFVL